jgi:hypothetical protein
MKKAYLLFSPIFLSPLLFACSNNGGSTPYSDLTYGKD